MRFVGGCAVLMMRDGFVFAQFVFLIQSFGRSPATTQAEAAVELLPAAVTKQHQAHAMYTHFSMVWCRPQRTITESIFITCMEVFEIHVCRSNHSVYLASVLSDPHASYASLPEQPIYVMYNNSDSRND